MNKILALTAIVLAVCAGCQVVPPSTVDELAAALKKNGVDYSSTSPVQLPSGDHFRIDEGVILKNDGVWVEIIRIEDDNVFNIAEGAVGFLGLAEIVAGQEFPGKPQIYPRDPFIIVVRAEPVENQVLKALDKVLPAKKEE